jgi:hypothetical protein
MRRLAGVTLIAGSLLFFVGAVTPVNSRVFGTDESLLKLRYIEEDPAAWDLAMTMLGLGGLIAAIGLVPLARSVQQVTDRRVLRSHRLWSRDARDRRRRVVGHHQLCPYRAVAR